MRFFLLSQKEQSTNLPRLYDWYDILKPIYMNPKDEWKIKDEQALYIYPNKNHLFADLLLAPFLLLSEKAQEVLKLYDPSFYYKEVFLLDPVNEKGRLYYLPIFSTIPREYMDYDNKINSIEEVLFSLEFIEKLPCFQVNFKTHLYYIFREDLLESLFIRGGVGFSISPIKIKERVK